MHDLPDDDLLRGAPAALSGLRDPGSVAAPDRETADCELSLWERLTVQGFTAVLAEKGDTAGAITLRPAVSGSRK